MWRPAHQAIAATNADAGMVKIQAQRIRFVDSRRPRCPAGAAVADDYVLPANRMRSVDGKETVR